MQLNNSESNLLECLPEKYQNISTELNTYFNSLRQRGDIEADALVKETFGQPNQNSRIGYNHLLDIADILGKTPELVLNRDTVIAEELKEYPVNLIKYFSPTEAPEWIDEEKLAISGELWQKDMLIVLTALYASSLPACYLMKNGIPALYQTAKLTSTSYIYQRIYETGVMLDAVLSPGGLKVLHDMDHSSEQHFADAINKMDPDGQWEKQGRSILRKNNKTSHVEIDELNNQLEANDKNQKPKRYLYGKGYITAKKVRFLHATMRFMLMNPELFPAHSHANDKKNFNEALRHVEKPYDADELGLPVNQEDLAYTLLTFGYCIPMGLEKLGRIWNRQQREAFLHTWKVIGHTIGIQDNLMTDNWDEAERMFHVIQRRQAGESEQAKVLTGTLISFLQDYLPKYFNLNKGISACLIRKQLGDEQTKMIMPQEYFKASKGLVTTFTYSLVIVILNIYFPIRRTLYRLPVISGFFTNTFYNIGIELVNSWRGVYSRKPFYIAKGADEWQIKQGVNLAFRNKLRDWRHKLFNTVGIGIGAVIASFISSAVYAYSTLIKQQSFEAQSGWASIILMSIGIYILRYHAKAVSQSRPEIDDHPRVQLADEKV